MWRKPCLSPASFGTNVLTMFLTLTSVTVSAYLGAICYHDFISQGHWSLIRNYLKSTYHVNNIIITLVLQVVLLTAVLLLLVDDGLIMLLVVIVMIIVVIIVKLLFYFLADVASKIFPLTFEEDFLVLPLDVTDFPTHEDCPETVIKQFGKVTEIHFLYLLLVSRNLIYFRLFVLVSEL